MHKQRVDKSYLALELLHTANRILVLYLDQSTESPAKKITLARGHTVTTRLSLMSLKK